LSSGAASLLVADISTSFLAFARRSETGGNGKKSRLGMLLIERQGRMVSRIVCHFIRFLLRHLSFELRVR
jgi:hypothetical protein